MAQRKSGEQDKQRVNGDDTENGAPFRLHGDMLTTTLLAFLRNWNAYGYQLAQQLNEAGLPSFDSGTVYRTLRQLERAGMVSSFWDTSESGPARRMYSLTNAGDIFLTSWIDVLGRYQAVFRKTMEGLAPQAGDAATDEKPRTARG
ncbi:MAG: helix-turn-helix transcriptional regulator [Dehalococcoidia bacterium]